MISSLKRRFSMKLVPQVDLTNFIKTRNDNNAIREVTEALHKFGCVAVKDPRVSFEQNEEYQDLMQTYFIKRANEFYKTGKTQDVYPETGYGTGLTPERTEKARPHPELIASYTPENKPVSPVVPVFDEKWRYMFPMKMSEHSSCGELDPDHKNPVDFPNFSVLMRKWGDNLYNCGEVVAQMVARGLDMPEDFFSAKMKTGHNLVAPTGSDLLKNKKGAIFAGFHYDFNLISVHGKSRFPGLYIWLKTGERIPVSVPPGHLLIQSGKQMEYYTGGYIIKGMHEVVYDDKVEEKVKELLKKGQKDIFRVSSTMFIHVGGEYILEPHGKFRNEETIKKYPKISAYEDKEIELKAISLL